MTYEEAKRILHPDTTLEALAEIEFLGGFKGKEKLQEAVDEACLMACEALDKKIPKTLNSGVDRTWGTPTKEAICPACDYALGHWEFIGGGKKITYCEHCGQAIDWEGWKWED